MKFSKIIFITTMIFFMACNNSNKKDNKTSDTSDQSTSSKTTDQMSDPYPAPTIEFMQKLFNNTLNIDYLVRETNFSISQDNPDAIKSVIATFGNTPPKQLNNSCFPKVRLSLSGEAGMLSEIELYLDPSCGYMVYYVDQKPTYSAMFTQEAYNYFMNLLNKAAGTAKSGNPNAQ